MAPRYSSKAAYQTMDTIVNLLRELPCHGREVDGGRAFDNLLDFVTVERTALLIRAANSEAALRRKKVKPEEGTTYVH